MTQNPVVGGLLISLPVTVDLMKFASWLKVNGGNRKVAGALRTAWKTQSCLADLSQAQGACDALDLLKSTAPSLGSGALDNICSGVLGTAILLYARATTTSSSKFKERGSIALDLAKLTPEQRADHDALVRIRNGALSHVQTHEKIAGDYWHREILVAKRAGPANWEVVSASQSIGFHELAFKTLKRQLPIATEQLETKCRERLVGAIAAIRELNPPETDLMRHQVNPIELFGSIDAALMALGTSSGEEASAWTPLL